jgi:hypothetical protein
MTQAGLPVVLAVCIAAPACVNISATDSRYVEREEQRFTVSGRADLTLETFDGSIEVRSWNRNEVLIVVEKRARDREAIDGIRIDSRQDGDRIVFGAREEERRGRHRGFGQGSSARLIATVPVASAIRARSGDGRVQIEDIEGDVTVNTGDGRVQIENVVGDVAVETGDGSVRLDSVNGGVNLRSADGLIRVTGRLSRVRARTGDGSITVLAGPGSQANADWDIATGDGAVRLELPVDFDAELDAHTGDGRVTLEDLSFSDQGGARGGQLRTLRGALNQGGSAVHVRTGDGSISVRGS